MAFTYGSYGYAKDSNGTTIAYNGTNVYQIRLGYQVNSQDIENNTSNVSLQLEVRSINSSYKTYGYNQTTTIDGTSLASKTFDFRSTNTWQIFGTRTITVSHNADGTYDVNKSGSFTTTATGTGRPHSGSASVQMILPTIPRASTITVNDANIGSSTNIVINKASSSFTTTLEYSTDNSNWVNIATKTSNQVYGWTVPTSFYSLIPNSKTLTCYFRATTYSGDTNVGVKTTTATFTATGNPVINSSSAIDTNATTVALTGNNANMVKYASNVQVSVSASGQNSATISSITVNGNNVSGGSITFNNATTNSFEIKVIDSRGYTTTTTKTMTMVNYVPLSINATIKRNQPTDEKINISVSGNYFNDSFGSQSNTLTVQYRYKESTSNTWGNWTNLSTTLNGNTYSGSTQLSNMDYTKQYNFEIKATDKVGTKQITGITVSKGTPVYWWDDDQFNINGKLYTSIAGREDYAAFGFVYDGAGNMKHKRNEGGDYFQIQANDGSTKVQVYPESGETNVYGTVKGANGFYSSTDTSSANSQTVSNGLTIKHGTNPTTPGNGMVLEVSRFQNWGGQLYIGDNGEEGLYFGGWYNGTKSGWKKLAWESQIPTAGSNGNGTWLKFNDGTMICSKKVSGTINISTGWGNGYTSGDISLGSWAETFTSTPEIQITGQRGTGGMNFWLGAEQDVSTTSAGKIVLLRFTSASNVNYILHITAIGRWK